VAKKPYNLLQNKGEATILTLGTLLRNDRQEQLSPNLQAVADTY